MSSININEYKGLLQFAATKEQYDAIYLSLKHGSVEKASKKLGVSRTTIGKRIARVRSRAAKRGWSPDHDMKKIAPEGFLVNGTSTLYDSEGNLVQQWVKTSKEFDDIQEALRVYAEELCCEFRGKYRSPFKKPRVSPGNLASAFVVGDAHLGLYAYGLETGGEDQNLSGACDDILSGFSNLIDRSVDCCQGIFINVGDWFHANSRIPATPANGNILDVDSRFGKVARVGAELQKELVGMLLEKFPEVILINAKGNHDTDASMWLNVLAKAVFEKEPRVNVIDNDTKMLHYTWGNTALFVYHGEKNAIRQHQYIASKLRNIHGAAKNSYALNGHVHHKEVREMGGVFFESFNTLIAKDAYHAENLYDSARTMTNIIYHKEFGETGRNVFDIRMNR